MPADSNPIDLLGIGFGPANLAVAAALAEYNTVENRVSAVFVDEQQRFGWHRAMLVPGAQMQVSFLKDLVTLRNPQSQFSFVNYLHTRGRLVDFINQQRTVASRVEFHDYLDWAAQTVGADVRYRRRAVAVHPHPAGGFAVLTATPEGADEQLLHAAALVLGGGCRPVLPAGVTSTKRQWHSHGLLDHLAELAPVQPRRFAVIGAGQSAAETVAYLHARYPGAEVHSVFRKFGYTPADNSPYVNRLFDPMSVDTFYEADDDIRAHLLHQHRSTNYSAVDLSLIEELYAREYEERVVGKRRLFMQNSSVLVDAQDLGSEVLLTIEHLPTGAVQTLNCDAVVYATGFAPMPVDALLGELADCYEFDRSGRPRVDRDYRLRARPGAPGAIFLNGAVEHTHGLSSSLLSNLAVRAGEIVDAVCRMR